MIELTELDIRDGPPMKRKYARGGQRKLDNKDFIFWDGEGITYPGETQQSYVLFGNSSGFEISGRDLSTQECIGVMMDTERLYPNAIHCGFAFTYDTEMILKDLSIKHMHVLHRLGSVRWNGYRIEFRKGKWLQVTRKTKTEHTVCRIWDVWSFFSTSFVKALQEYLGDDPDAQEIAAGKLSRNVFTYAELEAVIRPYWRAELRVGVRLMETLRERLYGADLRIHNWHGPGAIATYAMTQRGVKKTMATIPDDVAECSRFAYAGGRFELFKLGYHHETVHSYDIRSAYPSAIRQLPNLSTGLWRHVDKPNAVATFGMYRIRFHHADLFTTRPMPFPFRDSHSAVHFPNVVEGWYWSPEAKLTQYLGSDAEIVEGWEYTDNGERPFEWINETYEMRSQWKREGNPSQIALKLLMNSMYGKFAQRVGFKGTESPTWHQLEWAGYITSYTRAKLFQAMVEAHKTGSLISVETDGIFTTEPLTHLTIGDKLGEWEHETYDAMIYLQSGFYFKQKNGVWNAKCRGFNAGSVTVDDAISSLDKWEAWNPDSLAHIVGVSTRFVTMGQYLRMHNADKQRRRWITEGRELALGTDGKRVHRPLFCTACANQQSPGKAMHDMTIYQPIGGMTFPHILPWITDRINPFRNPTSGVEQ